MLAGGRSERFGDVDKLGVEIGGVPLVTLAVRAVAEVADDVVVVLPPGATRLVLPASARAVHDPTEGEGPLAGVHAGLLAIERSDAAVVVGGDMPELQPPVLRAMLARLDDPAVDLVALDDGGHPRPLPIVVRPRPAADAARTLLRAGRRRLRDLVASLPAAVLHEGSWVPLDPDRRTFRDVDEPGDLTG